jgi:hypothetical protein
MSDEQVKLLESFIRTLDTLGDMGSGAVEAANELIARLASYPPQYGTKSHSDGLRMSDALERYAEAVQRFIDRTSEHLPTLVEKTRVVRRMLSEN